jgi:hypothetical protein
MVIKGSLSLNSEHIITSDAIHATSIIKASAASVATVEPVQQALLSEKHLMASCLSGGYNRSAAAHFASQRQS